MFIDSHAHLTSDTLYPEVETLLDRARAAKVKNIINICTDLSTLKRGLELHREHPWVYNTGATTPHDVEKEGELYFSHFESAAKEGLLVAIGETGLDYYYEHSQKEVQKEFFIRYIQLAKECSLPLVIHCRDAFDDFFEIIDEHYPKGAPGILHCFTGTLSEAKELIKRGWTISFSGIITFKKSEALRGVVEHVPIDQMLIETDSPYLAPQRRRGKTCEPAFVVETAEMVAEIKGLRLDEVAKITSKNAASLFRIEGS